MSPFALPDSVLESLLQDDTPYGDATTWGLGIGDAPGRLMFRARHTQVACCTEEAARMGALRGLHLDGALVTSGTPVAAGTLLVFAEHRAFLGGEAPTDIVARLHRRWPERQVVVEVANEAEALAWIDAGADVIQLEKCAPDTVAAVVQRTAGRAVKIAAAGGVNAANAEAYARAGAHILVSSAPYCAAPRDVAVTLTPA